MKLTNQTSCSVALTTFLFLSQLSAALPAGLASVPVLEDNSRPEALELIRKLSDAKDQAEPLEDSVNTPEDVESENSMVLQVQVSSVVDPDAELERALELKFSGTGSLMESSCATEWPESERISERPVYTHVHPDTFITRI